MNKKVVLLAFVLFCLCVVGLLELQIVYASPYTNIDVYTAHNMITGGFYPDLVVLDVRTKSEYDSGHIYGAVWIPHTELEARIEELAGHENHEIIVYCGSGVRSVTASEILDSHNFTKVYNMLGGIMGWQSAGYPVWIATVHNLNTTFNYDTIQAAMDAPQTLDGHTISVDAGMYCENVVVDKAVWLIGEFSVTTIIDGNGTGTVVRIKESGVEVRGFTIQNGGHDITDCGIFVANSTANTICNNIIRNNAYGIELLKSNSTSIIGNTVTNNSWAGIYIHGESSENVIHDNTVANNPKGAWIASSNAYSNTFYHDNFIDNTNQAFDFGNGTIWDDGYPSGGNYWSDYNGTDLYSGPYQNETCSDGIGDITYFIDGNNQDSYPLIRPYGSVRNLDTSLSYLTIQSAMNDPETLDGHTILVDAGIYYEHVTINKSISLIGENESTTMIHGNGNGNLVVVEGAGITVTGFTLRNASVGLYILGFNHTIIGNIVLDNTYHGIDLVGRNNCISENTITKNCYGIILSGSNYNIISRNTIMNNQGGINLCEDCEDNDINKNTLINNTVGIGITGNNNSVIGNTIKENWSGIEIAGTNNTIYHNNFINNTIQASVETGFANTWESGYEGNYWSNYNGTDLDGDGIGDEYLPWEGVDYYPLMSPYMERPYLEGDVNHDGRVSITDIVIVALVFGSQPGDPNWNPVADLNGDGKITVTDIVIVALHFGETV